jgi:hypothetical protein
LGNNIKNIFKLTEREWGIRIGFLECIRCAWGRANDDVGVGNGNDKDDDDDGGGGGGGDGGAIADVG